MATFSNKFISTGARTFLPFQQVDEADFWNASTGVSFKWYRGMENGKAILIAQNGDKTFPATKVITPIKTSIPTIEAEKDVASITNAVQPVFIYDMAPGYVTNDIIRVYSSTNQRTIMGIDFAVTMNGPGTQATTVCTLPNEPSELGGGEGKSVRIPYGSPFYPAYRNIADMIAVGQTLKVFTTVPHGYAAGGRVTFQVDRAFGMYQVNELTGTITDANPDSTAPAKNSISFIVDIDATAFSAFEWPISQTLTYTYPTVAPEGTDIAYALKNNESIYASAYSDRSFIGLQLEAGVSAPVGVAGNEIWWSASANFSHDEIEPVDV